MEEQGASQEEVQAYIDSVKGQLNENPGVIKQSMPAAPAGAPAEPLTDREQQEEDGSILGNMGRAIIRTPLRAASSLAPMAEAAYAAVSPNFSMEDIQRRNQEGRDFGVFGQDVKPLGWQAGADDMSLKEKAGRMTADVVGSGLEMASYAYAPLRGAGSFKGMLWQAGTSKAVGTFTAGEVLQGIGRGEDLGEAGKQGALNHVAATAATALLGKGGQLFQKWGARALQSKAVQNNLSRIKHLFNDVMTDYGDDVTKMADIDYGANMATNRSADVYRSEFNTAMTDLRDSTIEQLQPSVNNPDLTFHEVKMSLRRKLGQMFVMKDDLYNQVKADPFKVEGYNTKNLNKMLAELDVTPDKINKMIPDDQKAVYDNLVRRGVTPEEAALAVGVTLPKADPAAIALRDLSRMTDEGMTTGQMLDQHQKFLQLASSADDPEQAKMLNEIAAGIFRDTQSILKKNGRDDLVNLMNEAYVGHQKAVDLMQSQSLNRFKNAGEFDTFFSDFIDTGFKNEAEERIFRELAQEHPDEVRALILDNVLRRVRNTNLEEGNKILNDFLGDIDTKKFSWAKATLKPEDLDYLKSLNDLTGNNFQSVIDAIKAESTPINATEQELRDLMSQHSVIKVSDAIDKFSMDEFGDGITRLFKRNPEAMGKIINNMSPEDRQLTRLSMMRRVYDSNLEVIQRNPDGSLRVDENFMHEAQKMLDDIHIMQRRTGDPTLYGLFDPEDVTKMDDMIKMINSQQYLEEIPQGQMKTFMAGIVGTFYAARGWMPGALHNYGQFVKGMTQDEKLYYEAVENAMVGLDKNGRLTTGMILEEMANTYNVGVAFSEGLEGATTDTEEANK